MLRFVAPALSTAACLAVAGTPAAAHPRKGEAARPVLADHRFDLAEARAAQLREDEALALPADTTPPRGAQLSRRDYTPPAVAFEVAANGPVLRAGALGSRQRGMPKLAHVAVDWTF